MTLDQYAVIGNPISHSRSPRIHTIFAQQTNQSMAYSAILAPLDQFKITVMQLIQQNGRGANVTVPFKLEAYQIATRLTERASLAQAVNTLKFENDEILGDNTDGIGLIHDITRNLAVNLAKKRILLIGAGGASRGVIMPLLQQKPIRLVVANRTFEKAKTLQQQFECYGDITACNFDNLSNQVFDIVINATSADLQNTFPDIPACIFAEDSLAYDMMYRAEPTTFLRFAQRCGVSRLADGIGMLVEQAAESFYVWRNVYPETRSIIAMLKSQAHINESAHKNQIK
ncbi:shikimate dehydrogenase [Nitrosomonas sp. PY1]|uniref:shikimate dehydrogenase n=1 Tax=Nitrosomonas sp. PY1 TaxID=1803906 RepID=UPI001FC837AD|nr:shikimate dehydrogenase [Nitrosomonas sp. PY1]GKS68435.1 shikimate dehydrogenase [Nitrosomonas sp. PY1]